MAEEFWLLGQNPHDLVGMKVFLIFFSVSALIFPLAIKYLNTNYLSSISSCLQNQCYIFENIKLVKLRKYVENFSCKWKITHFINLSLWTPSHNNTWTYTFYFSMLMGSFSEVLSSHNDFFFYYILLKSNFFLCFPFENLKKVLMHALFAAVIFGGLCCLGSISYYVE